MIAHVMISIIKAAAWSGASSIIRCAEGSPCWRVGQRWLVVSALDAPMHARVFRFVIVASPAPLQWPRDAALNGTYTYTTMFGLLGEDRKIKDCRHVGTCRLKASTCRKPHVRHRAALHMRMELHENDGKAGAALPTV